MFFYDQKEFFARFCIFVYFCSSHICFFGKFVCSADSNDPDNTSISDISKPYTTNTAATANFTAVTTSTSTTCSTPTVTTTCGKTFGF